jgi:hypothetical protein
VNLVQRSASRRTSCSRSVVRCAGRCFLLRIPIRWRRPARRFAGPPNPGAGDGRKGPPPPGSGVVWVWGRS